MRLINYGPIPLFLWLMTLAACNNSQPAAEKIAGNKVPVSQSAKTSHLRMKLNGKAWEADHELTGIVFPEGYNKALLIGGTKGPKDKYEQAFNLNLFNCNGVGEYLIETGNKDQSVVQLGNLSEEHYLYGSVLGFRMKVTISKLSKTPVEIEAVFEGQMTGNAGDTIHITEGKFYYYE